MTGNSSGLLPFHVNFYFYNYQDQLSQHFYHTLRKMNMVASWILELQKDIVTIVYYYQYQLSPLSEDSDKHRTMKMDPIIIQVNYYLCL